MNDTRYLQDLDNLKHEQIEKAKILEGRYESGTLNERGYQDQMKGVNNTVDILDKQIEEEIKNQGLSEQEYLEARDGWRQEQEQDRGR